MADAPLHVIQSHLQESSRVKVELAKQSEQILAVAEALEKTVRNGGTIFTCGNGGSSCDASHFTEELVARYLRERPGIKAQHFSDPGILTCWSNDYSYAGVFERYTETFVESKDALVGFSTSGNSENVNRALAVGRKKDATTIALLGKDGGKAKEIAQFSLIVPSSSTAHIQESHIAIVHILCELLETKLFVNT